LLAEVGQAEFLVTGDRKLLMKERHVSTRIVTAAPMAALLEGDAPG
jgi:predicted nucleic acid-binding protein